MLEEYLGDDRWSQVFSVLGLLIAAYAFLSNLRYIVGTVLAVTGGLLLVTGVQQRLRDRIQRDIPRQALGVAGFLLILLGFAIIPLPTDAVSTTTNTNSAPTSSPSTAGDTQQETNQTEQQPNVTKNQTDTAPENNTTNTTANTTNQQNNESEDTNTTVLVTTVTDGDTVDIRYPNGSTDTVRLLGVDTPETYGGTNPEEFEGIPDTWQGRDCLETWGTQASEYTQNHLDGENVTLLFDANEGRRGSYGRLLAYIYVDGTFFNYRLIDHGYARVYDSQFTKRQRFYEAESAAQDQREGLWECITDGKEGIILEGYQADAFGDERDNLNSEYVIFSNEGLNAMDMSGWTLEDAADHTYYFPQDFTLPANSSVTIHTGHGTDNTTDLYWDMSAPVWNNDGDTITLRDDTGSVVVKQSY